jgi:general stress protein YciG
MIICQHDWVNQCLIKYRYEPIPDEEHWEDAHYPIPSCEGGTETIKLWSRDHAVHGVLQSESLGRPCLHGFRVKTDRELISKFHPEYLPLYEKWYLEHKSRAGKVGGSRVPREAKSRGGRNQPMEVKKANFAKLTPEQRSEAGRKGGSNTPPEIRRNSGLTATSQRWQCTVTGFITNAASLSRYQMKRGIDTSNRIRIG